MITAAQLRGARGLLGWSQANLAEAAAISLPTVKRMEGSKGPGKSSAENVAAVQQALESAGVVFIAENGGGPGVRLAKSSAAAEGS